MKFYCISDAAMETTETSEIVTVPSRNQILFQFFSSASKCTRRCLIVPRGHNSQKNGPQKSWNNI